MSEIIDSKFNKCDICDKAFHKRCKLNDHLKLAHRSECFKCDSCSKLYANRQNLNTHKKLVHSNEKNVKCDFCDAEFKSSLSKEYH